MKAITIDDYVAENNYKAPIWWVNFTEDIVNYNLREQTKKRYRVGEWLRDVNQKLLNYGGRMQKRSDGDYLLTFRLESNYTFFMLKYA